MHRANKLDLDDISITESLATGANLALLDEGRKIHYFVIKIGLESEFRATNASMDTYGKCGELEDVLKKDNKTFQTYATSGTKTRAYHLTSLLSAFNHGGLVDEGLACFTHMASEFHVHPRIEHGACVVDLLGRARRLTDAENFIKKMPIRPNDLIWRSFLSACRTHNNVELGKKASKHLLDLDSSDYSAYVFYQMFMLLIGGGKTWRPLGGKWKSAM